MKIRPLNDWAVIIPAEAEVRTGLLRLHLGEPLHLDMTPHSEIERLQPKFGRLALL